MNYLLKVTLVWTVLLLLFEAFYKNSGRFTVNRLYLVGSVVGGLLLPLLRLPQAYIPDNTFTHAFTAGMTAPEPSFLHPAPGSDSTAAAWSFRDVIRYLYLAGACLFLAVSIREIGIILRHAIYSQYQVMDGHRIFTTQRKIAPYSFMGWIFISTGSIYTRDELAFVLTHEATHNERRHWLDLLAVQLVCVLFWFHPLVWRFRYLLRLQHEYEADHVTAGGDAYTYGHFLLQQTLLKGSPFIAHSFHFSPIKNRINMLTKMQQGRFLNLKYALTIPVLFACTVLMARSGGQEGRIRTGNKTHFRGNDVYWKEVNPDTILIQNAATGKWDTAVMRHAPVIVKLNNEPVVENKDAANQAQFRAGNLNFDEYLKEQFLKLSRNTPDSIGEIQVTDMVVDARGKIVYYELSYMNAKQTPMGAIYGTHSSLNEIMDKVISGSPDWLPATKDGKAVNALLPLGGAISLKPITMTAEPSPQKGTSGKSAGKAVRATDAATK